MAGQSLIVQPNSNIELREFVKGLKGTNHFKFIQKTKRIMNYRGDRVDDGLVRVEFKFEKRKREIIPPVIYSDLWPCRTQVCPCCHKWPCECYKPRSWSDCDSWRYTSDTLTSNGGGGGSASSCNAFYSASNTGGNFGNTKIAASSTRNKTKKSLSTRPLPDEGITVKGSKSNRNFNYGYTGELESKSSVIVIKLRGTKKNGTAIRKPVTVKTKLMCSTCGRKSKSSAKYCKHCGTYLE
jgi:hypothetical protein